MKIIRRIGAGLSGALLLGGLALGGGVPASAASLPSCATGVHCTNNTAGEEAGYYGADDLHTHYRFVQTTVIATPQLVNLNGLNCSSTNAQCAIVGDEVCDETGDNVAEDGLWWNPVDKLYEISYEGPGVANYKKLPVTVSTSDPSVQSGISAPLIGGGSAPELVGPASNRPGLVIAAGDKVYLGVFYTPSGRHEHQISFGACDETQGWCVQEYATSRVSLNFTEFGVGAFTPGNQLTADAVNEFETFSSVDVTCFSCSHMVPISSVSPANPFGAGGLYEARFLNTSSQVVMSPNDSLSGDTFDVFNGSTSI